MVVNPFPFFLLLGIATLCVSLSVYYMYLMNRYKRNWRALDRWEIPHDFIPQTKLTILIPARDEAANIASCLDSILVQDYPKKLLEVIVIDDHSTDSTADIVASYAKDHSVVSLLKLSDFQAAKDNTAFKKWAISQGIASASGDLIVGTDADCIVPLNWLNYLVSFYQNKKAVFIAAPVNFHEEKNAFECFQSLDFVGMMGITGGGIYGRFQHMCNGANLAYEKKAFTAVGGFEGIDGKASGDDMLLLQKMARRFPDRIGFLKNEAATVKTKAMPDWKQFMDQRVRWASKSSDYTEWRITFRLAMVFAFCWAIILSPFLVLYYDLWSICFFLGMLSVKVLVDYWYLGEVSRFFRRGDLMKSYLYAVPLHIIYVAVVGLVANLSPTYKWKGREVR